MKLPLPPIPHLGGVGDFSALGLWRTLSGVPGGKTVFSRAVAFRAPYFASISPHIERLAPGLCEVRIADRRAVHNHLGTVHAIAMCNACEVAAGVLSEATTPQTHRWIPKGMTVAYLARARGELTATGIVDPLPDFGPDGFDMVVPVDVTDGAGTVVVHADITMRITPRPQA